MKNSTGMVLSSTGEQATIKIGRKGEAHGRELTHGVGWRNCGVPMMLIVALTVLVPEAQAQPFSVTGSVPSTWGWVRRDAPLPTGRQHYGLAFDSSRARAVLFGGWAAGSGIVNDTWEWDGLTWTASNPATSPSARYGPAMAYDPGRRRAVLFGGAVTEPGGLSDTWEWNGITWTQRVPATSPSPRFLPAMTFDAARNRVILFGGESPTGVSLNDTWEWDGQNWFARTPQNPPPARRTHRLTFDARRSKVVLFGGYDGTNPLGDTWEYDGANWLQRFPATAPRPMRSASLTFDPVLGKTVLFGGYSDLDGMLRETWTWDGTAWEHHIPSTLPPIRAGHHVWYDPTRGHVLTFGGNNGSTYLSDTWEYDGTNWASVSEPTTSPTRRQAGLAYDESKKHVVLFGGGDLSGNRSDTWSWNGVTWVQIGTTASPSVRIRHALAYDPPHDRLIMFGGGSDNLTNNETWELAGTEWTRLYPSISPTDRNEVELVFDAARLEHILFGGVSAPSGTAYNDTWSWDGTNWAQRSSTTSPPTRSARGALTYDAARQRVLLFGGNGTGGRQGDTWEWNGASWSQLTPSTSPSPRYGHAMTYDSTARQVMLYGGSSTEQTSGLSDLWAWQGTAWTRLSPAGAPATRIEPEMTYDQGRGVLVLHGGHQGDVTSTLSDTWELPSNRPPTLTAQATPSSAKTNQVITLSSRFTDPDSDTPTYRWLQTFGPRVTLNNPASATATFSTTIATTYGFEVVASDGHEGYAYALGTVNVAAGPTNRQPGLVTATASSSRVIPGSSVSLTAACTDPDGDVLTYSWTIPTKPSGAVYSLTGASTANASLTGTTQGGYTLVCTVSDGRGGSTSSSVSITVVPAGGTTFSTAGSVPSTWGWVQRCLPLPSARGGHGLAPDPLHRGITLFGGGSDASLATTQTWVWGGSEWGPVATGGSPPPRTNTALAFDSKRRRVVLFGGETAAGNLADTWEFDGTSWIQKLPASSPAALRRHSLAYDAKRGRTVLFGGTTGTLQNVTWQWDGTSWARMSPQAAPSPRAGASMAFDPVRGRVILFGGDTGGTSLLDTWEWTGADWSQLSPVASPPARWHAGVTTDWSRSRVVLFGGWSSVYTGHRNDTWEWNGTTWAQVATAVSPSVRGYPAMGFDEIRKRTALFGGESPSTARLQDTWEFDGTNWKLVSAQPTATPSARYGHGLTATTGGRVVLFAGFRSSSDNFNDTWEWDGVLWSQKSPTSSPPARNYLALSYDSARDRAVLFGGAGPGDTGLGDTWEWDGSSWLQAIPVTSPPARRFTRLSYDSIRARTVLFGGGGEETVRFSDTWLWNGLEWTAQTPPAFPSARAFHSMAFDEVRERLVLFDGPLLADTWEWNGSTWTPRSPVSSPPTRAGQASAYDNDRRRVVIFGGNDGVTGYTNDLWEWNGTGWSQSFPANPPTPRVHHSICYDKVRRRLVLFGGQRPPPLADTWELPSNRPPSLTATLSPSAPVPGQVVTLAASFTDPDGDTPTWRWMQTYGPPVTLQNAGSALATFATTIATSYGFQVVADDGHEGYAYAVGDVTVRDVPAGLTYLTTNEKGYREFRNDKDGSVLIEVPAGTFPMGSTTGTGNGNEWPQHQVTLAPFYVGKYEVTNAQYAAFLAATADPKGPAQHQGHHPDESASKNHTPNNWNGHGDGTYSNGDDHPVIYVDWYDAYAYCAWAGLALPTEAQWERVARGQDARTYPWGEAVINADDQYRANYVGSSDGYSHTAPRGMFPLGQSPVGALDTVGNVWEWCTDWYSSTFYSSPSATDNPDNQTPGTYRVFRGGGWDNGAYYQRAAYRDFGVIVPTGRYYTIGFRASKTSASAPNSAPFGTTAIASSPRVLPGTTVALTGTATDPDGDTLTYAWAFTSQPAGGNGNLTNPATATPTFSATGSGTYAIQLTVSDGKGGSGTASVSIVVNTPPTANAGADRLVQLSSAVSLTATGVDADGDVLSYQWSYVSNPASPTLNGALTRQVSFTPTVRGLYRLRVTVTDPQAGTGFDDIDVTVNAPPVVNAGSDRSVQTGTGVSFDAVTSDPDSDPVTYLWSQVSGPSTLSFTGATSRQMSFTPAVAGTYVVRCTVSDGRGGSAADDASVTVTAQPVNGRPTALPGSPQTVDVGTVVTLTGSGTDPESQALTYLWAQTGGPVTVTLSNPSSRVTSFLAPTAGTYAFQLTVNDGQAQNNTNSASTSVTVNSVNHAPVPSARTDPAGSTGVGSTVRLIGTATDSDGDALTYSWSQTAGPIVALSVTGTASTSVILNVAGTFSFNLRVRDEHGAEANASVSVTAASPQGLSLGWSPRTTAGGLVPAIVGEPYAVTFTTSNGVAPYFYAFYPGSEPPPGLALGLKDGVLRGIPTQVNTLGYTFSIQAADSSFHTTAVPLKLVVQTPRFPESPHNPYPAAANRSWTYRSLTSPAPVALDVVFDDFTEFEDGVDFLYVTDSAGRQVSGSPFTGMQLKGRTIRVAGTSCTLRLVTDASDPPGRSYYGFRVSDIREILSTQSDLRISAIPLPAGRVGAVFAFQLSAEGGMPPYRWDTIGGAPLPAGLRLSTSGLLSGIPATPGSGNIQLLLRDAGSGLQLPTLPFLIKSGVVPRLSRVLGTPTAGALPVQVSLTGMGGRVPLREVLAVLAYDPALLSPGTVTPGPAAGQASLLSAVVGLGARSYLLIGDLTSDGLLFTDALGFSGSLPSPGAALERLAFLTLSRLQDRDGEIYYVLPPTADASISQRVLFGKNGMAAVPDPTVRGMKRGYVTLDGRRSIDPLGRRLTYSWTQLEGPTVTLSAPTACTPTFVPPRPASYRFALTVQNTDGLMSVPAQTRVEAATHDITAMPVLKAVSATRSTQPGGAPLEMTAGDLVELDARGSGDSEPEHRDRLTYRWSCSRAGLLLASQVTAPRVVLAAPTAPGEVTFSLVVSDNEGFSSEAATLKMNVRAAGKSGLRLMTTALSTVDGTQGSGLALGLQTAVSNSLRASAMTPVLLRVAVLDAAGTDVTTGCLVEWTAKTGPEPELEGSRTASPTMRPTTAGVHELECSARQVAVGTGATLVEASGLIRVAVGSQTQPVPQAAASVRMGGAGKTERSLAADGALVAAAGTMVNLDAAGSSSLTSSPVALDYTWRQVASPVVTISDFTSPVCTFEAPDLRDGVEHEMLFHLTVRADGLESEPAPVSIRVTPPGTGTFQLDLQPGLNLVALPMEPTMQDRLVRAADFAPVTGSSFLARWASTAAGTGGVFQPFLPTSDDLGFVLEGNRGYILMHQGPAASPRLQGRSWSWSVRNRTVSLTPGLNLIGFSQIPPANYTSANLMQLTGAAFVARLRPATTAGTPKFDLYGAGFGTPAFPILAGKAYLLSVPVAKTVELPRGQ